MTTPNRGIFVLLATSIAACADLAEVPSASSVAGPPTVTEQQSFAGHAADQAPEIVDEMSMRDLQNEGHELHANDIGEDFSTVEEDISLVRRADVPPEALDELDRAAKERLIPKDLIGDTDGRSPVADSTTAPYRSIVKIYTRYTEGGALYGCSGSLIAPDAVLTAAHCVFNSTRVARGYAYSVTVVPGSYPKSPLPASGTRYESPFGSSAGKKLFVPSAYIDKESNSWNKVPYDYAVIRLKASLGAVGTRPFGVLQSPLGQRAVVTGYHKDLEKGLRQYTSRDQIRKVFDVGVLSHYADTEHGASGSGITGAGAWADKIFAVHSSGFESYNAAAAITKNNHPVIVDWALRAL